MQQFRRQLFLIRCIYYTSACFNAPSLGAAYGGRIPDSSFSATSSYDYVWLPKYGRLHGPRRGWTPQPLDNMPNEYLQIDLGGEYWVCGVATQGEGSASSPDEWTTKFKLNLSVNNSNWNIYHWNGSDKVGPVRVVTHQNEKNSLTFPCLLPDLQQNLADLKHGNLYRKLNIRFFTYLLAFCLHVQYAFLVLNFLSLLLWLGAHNIQNDINFPDFSLTLSRIPNFPDQMQLLKFTDFSLTLKTYRGNPAFVYRQQWLVSNIVCLPVLPEKWITPKTKTTNTTQYHVTYLRM